MMKQNTNILIIGAGIFGIYSAYFLAKKFPGLEITVVEKDTGIFSRASSINQARMHNGYHYPRSISTAITSKTYFNRFFKDVDFAINSSFEKISAISSNFSLTNSEMFIKFFENSNLPFKSIDPGLYFNSNLCDSAFLVREYSFDIQILKSFFLSEIFKRSNVKILLGENLISVNHNNGVSFEVTTGSGKVISSDYLINSTYSSINNILSLLGEDFLKLKHELCEVILTKSTDNLNNMGITIMDGPFFSVMPFGKTGFHTLTSVEYTPHASSYTPAPEFACQNKSNGYCSSKDLKNCNDCKHSPKSNWIYMNKIFKKYMKDEYQLSYHKSLFTIKTVISESELDDSRPTYVIRSTKIPNLISVLSGKINAIYDLEETLSNVKI